MGEMKVTDWLALLMVLFAVVWCLAFFVAFVVGDIQCSAAGWDDGTWYVVDTLCKNLDTEKLSVIKAGS